MSSFQRDRRLRAGLLRNPALVDVILARPDVFPPAEPTRIIPCPSGSVDRAIAVAAARALVLGELWRVEVEK